MCVCVCLCMCVFVCLCFHVCLSCRHNHTPTHTHTHTHSFSYMLFSWHTPSRYTGGCKRSNIGALAGRHSQKSARYAIYHAKIPIRLTIENFNFCLCETLSRCSMCWIHVRYSRSFDYCTLYCLKRLLFWLLGISVSVKQISCCCTCWIRARWPLHVFIRAKSTLLVFASMSMYTCIYW